MKYNFHPYDVLQIKRGNEWLDFGTLRNGDDAGRAMDLVDHKRVWDGQYQSFRIVRNGVTVYHRTEEV